MHTTMKRPAGWRPTRWQREVTVLALVVALSGCCPATNGAGLPPAPRSSVTYSQTGGIAGLDDSLVIDNQDKATASRGRGGQRLRTTVVALSPGEAGRLRTLLHQAHFGSLNCSYTTSSPIPDDYSYPVRYEGHTVQVAGRATSTPPALQALIGLLSVIQTRGVQASPASP